MGRLIIYGAGGFGMEVLDWMVDSHAKLSDVLGTARRPLAPVIFVDDQPPPLLGRNHVVWAPEAVQFGKEDHLVVAIGNGEARQRVLGKFSANEMTLTPRKLVPLRQGFRHISSVVASTVGMGRGVIMAPFSLVSHNVDVGEGCVINSHSAVGHDCSLGPYCTLAGHVTICGHVKLGELVSVGAGATILPGLSVGAGATVGAGAVVVQDVEPGDTVFGNPARKVGERK